MKRFIFLIFVLFVALPAHAALIDLDELLDSKQATKNAAILTQFRQVEELQIGGTHTYGNKTVLKKGPNAGKLDPKVLILNPDRDAHDLLNTDVLSILGSGFNLKLLNQLLQLCEKEGHFFKKVYINNVLVVLPVPDHLPLEVLKGQHLWFTQGSFNKKVKDIESSLHPYFLWLKKNPDDNLYQAYGRLLAPGGRLIFKSAGMTHLETTLLKGFFDTENVPRDYEQIALQQRLVFQNAEFTDFVARIKAILQKKGDQFPIDYLGLIKTYDTVPDTKSGLYTIQLQTHLLELSDFRISELAIKRFEGWGFTLSQSNDAYSIVIIAVKKE